MDDDARDRPADVPSGQPPAGACTWCGLSSLCADCAAAIERLWGDARR